MKDGDLIKWSLEGQCEDTFLPSILSFKSTLMTSFDQNSHLVLLGGTNLPALIMVDLITQTEHYFKLPLGNRGISIMKLLRDPHLLAYISSEGYLYVVDVTPTQGDL